MSADGPAFVDSNIIVYAHDRSEGEKRKIASDLIDHLATQGWLRLSTQVLQEVFVTVTGKILEPLSVDEALGLLTDLSEWPVQVIDPALIHCAGQLHRDAKVSFWDALILTAAAASGADRLYSEDLNAGQEIAGVRVVNPYAGGHPR